MDIFFVWLFFLLGSVLYIFSKTEVTVRSPLNGYRNSAHYYSINGWLITLRVFAGSMLFWLVATGKGKFDLFLPDAVTSFDLTIPPIAGLVGVGMDAGLDKVFARMGWQKIVPPVGGSITMVEETATTTEETTKTTTKVDVPSKVSQPKGD